MAGVTLNGVRKIYNEGKEQVAVDRVDVDVKDGEFVVLVGPSGCGKSTTLRMIAGLESISAGTVKIGDRVVNDVPPKARDIAMVFQNYALYPHMTVRENLGFALRLRNMSAEEIDKRVKVAPGSLGFIGNPAMNFVNGTVESGGPSQFIADGGNWEINLPSRVSAPLTSARTRAITMGIRPEDVSIVAGARTAPATATARLDLVESLGNETFIYARVGSHDITARVSPQSLPPIGSTVVLAFNLERAHFFSNDSGERIG